MLVPINVITRQALEELLPVAKAHDVGVVAMKPLSAKTSNLITCLYQPSLSLVSQEPELKAFLGETSDHQVTNALRYVLSQDVASVIPGLRSLHEVEVAANVRRTIPRINTQRAAALHLQLRQLLPRLCPMHALPTKNQHTRHPTIPRLQRNLWTQRMGKKTLWRIRS